MRDKARLIPLWRFMKSPKNIKKYFINIVKLTNLEEITILSQAFIDNYVELKKYHFENVDLRFGQVVCNKLQYIPGVYYNKEDHDVLIELGVEARKVLIWGQNYNKDMKRLKKTKWKLICNLTTEHIEAILEGNYTKDELYINAFKSELKWRKNSKY